MAAQHYMKVSWYRATGQKTTGKTLMKAKPCKPKTPTTTACVYGEDRNQTTGWSWSYAEHSVAWGAVVWKQASKRFGSYQERNAAVVETLTVTMECCSVQSIPKKGCGRVRKAQGREPWQQAQRAPAQGETRRFPLEMSEGQETSIHYFSPSRRPRGNKLNQGTAGLKQTKGATPPRRPLVKLWAILLRDVLKKDHAASARRWYGAF